MNVQVNEGAVKVTVGIDATTTDDKVTIDADALIIARQGEGYVVRAEGFATTETNTNTAPPADTVQYDPHYYYSGNNNLPVNMSVARALDKIDDMLYDSGESYLEGADVDIVQEVVKNIITDPDTSGRHTVIVVAGGVLKGMRNGDYVGVPFAWLFKGVVEGYITPPSTEQKPLGAYTAYAPIPIG